MNYQQYSKYVVVERGHTEARDLLDRLVQELRSVFTHTEITLVNRGRVLGYFREYIRLEFPSEAAARSAEGWIEAHFDVN